MTVISTHQGAFPLPCFWRTLNLRDSQDVKTKASRKRLFMYVSHRWWQHMEGAPNMRSIFPWSFTSRRNNANIWIFFFRKQILELFFLIFWLCVLLLRLAWCRVSHECYCVANIIMCIHTCAIFLFPEYEVGSWRYEMPALLCFTDPSVILFQHPRSNLTEALECCSGAAGALLQGSWRKLLRGFCNENLC